MIQHKTFTNRYLLCTHILWWVYVSVSCNRQFDVPPANADPEVDVTMNIIDLKKRYTSIGDFKRIEENQIISGIVIADDRSGNFYKQIIIQDETGGIPVLLEANNVYTQYPVGRRVFIKLKGMMIGDYGGTIQIGIDSSRSSDGRFLNVDGIPQALFDEYIIKGSFNNPVTPKLVVPTDFTGDFNDPLLSTLVQINDAEFRDADINKTYADPSTSVSAVNFTINTCGKRNIVLRNSSYARFAGLNVPDGNEILTGVPGIFNGTVQMFIRDTFDVQFSGKRCSGQIPVPTLRSIAELKAYATEDSTIPAGVFIKAIVVSDSKNEAAGNYRLQDATGGIQLRFANSNANPVASVGDSLIVTLGGLRLSLYNGGLQVNEVELVTQSGSGVITPRVTTISELKANNRLWESTVVTLSNVTIVTGSSGNAGTNYTITDATGQLNTFIRNTATIKMPAGASAITGYVSLFQSSATNELETQITLRNQEDIRGGRGGNFSFSYDFADVTNTTGTTDPTDAPDIEGITPGSFTARGVGNNSTARGRFSFNSWPVGAENGKDEFTGTVDLSKYYEVTLTPDAEQKLDLKKITFTLQRSGTGIRQVCVRSSLDNYSSNLLASIDPANENLSVVSSNIFQITDAATSAQEGCSLPLNGHEGITSPVTFRFYGFNAERNSGTFSIDHVQFEGMIR